MKSIKLGIEWVDEILPEGFPVNTSTIVSGPGGSGKPLIGYIFASGWLRKGGKIVFMLTSTTLEYLKSTMVLLGANIDNYSGKIFVIELDPGMEGIERISDTHIKANFVKPEIWDESLKIADAYFENNGDGLGTMVVGAALNLLFFSSTYGRKIQRKIKETIEEDKSKTYFFTVNSDAFKDMVEELESSADNLMFSRMEQPMKLYLNIARMKDVPFVKEEVEVPLSKEVLEEIRKEAERGKKNLIPAIKRL
ncbi:hypothetical protein B6U71_01255 [Euryarchaeota archaeon ex4484_178]|nr:MAG: hypothetical protein B6U71_01255 [Euryarchaeota archaeon ex4484_178]